MGIFLGFNTSEEGQESEQIDKKRILLLPSMSFSIEPNYFRHQLKKNYLPSECTRVRQRKIVHDQESAKPTHQPFLHLSYWTWNVYLQRDELDSPLDLKSYFFFFFLISITKEQKYFSLSFTEDYKLRRLTLGWPWHFIQPNPDASSVIKTITPHMYITQNT